MVNRGGLHVNPARVGAWMLAMLLGSANATTLQYEGRAMDPESGSLLYTERHLLREAAGNPVERLVTYHCPNGNAFARKSVDYRDSRWAPDFELNDARDGYREGLRRQEGAPWVFVRDSAGTRQRTAAIGTTSRLVADAGFDEFVRRNWQLLVAGETVSFSFALPANQRAYTFKLRRVGELRVGEVPAHLMRLKLGGLLGLIAPQIDVAYAKSSRRLLRFEGVTNLRDADGEQWSARIEFADRAPQASDDAEWARTLALSLRGRCG